MKKILVVDDSDTMITRIKIELEKYGMIEPIYARNYKEAADMLKEHNDDIKAALLDYNLPDAPKGEVITLVHEHNIPIVILTGTLDKDVQEMVLKSSVVDFVLKNNPMSISSAVSSIHRVLKNYDNTVLVVDPSAVYRRALTASLEKVHLNALEAKDGQEAMDIIDSGEHDIFLLITGYEMPKINGLELTLALREKYTKAQLSIIAMSSSEKEEITYKFLKFGANDFINKPFTDNEVATTINANLELLGLFGQIKDMANKDFLTGAYNRRFFFESGTATFLKARRKNAPVAVAMLDIDKFKNINDTYGHDAGDAAIKEIKDILDKNLRQSDLMARFGGEEFCILIEEISLEDVERLFEKIRRSFEENIIDIDGTKISYTVSMGVQYGMASSLEEMVRLSDEALYYAKENGRNQVKINQAEV